MMQPKKEQDRDIESIKKEILQLIQAYDGGLTEGELSRTMSTTDVTLRMHSINSLTNEGKIELFKRGSDLIYRAIDLKNSANHSAIFNSDNITIEEKAVYRVVEGAGSKGIWNREIRNQTKLSLQQMSKALKQLETKKLIKAVKSVTASKRKLYMLFGLEPDKSVTGGAWYSGTEFESEYVQVLHEQCYQFIKRKLTTAQENNDFLEAREAALVSSSEVKEYIDDLKISTVKLSLQDIEMVLETIVFDGLIEKITVKKECSKLPEVKVEKDSKLVTTSDEEESEASNETHYYRALSKLITSSGVMRSPCGLCPYVHECQPGAVISPEKCLYFERWFAT